MSEFALALLVALTGWWFSTGVILWLVHRNERHHRTIFVLATATMLLAYYGVGNSVYQSTPQSVVLAFCLALLLWGWLEMGYLMGFVWPQKGGMSTRCQHSVEDATWPSYMSLA